MWNDDEGREKWFWEEKIRKERKDIFPNSGVLVTYR